MEGGGYSTHHPGYRGPIDSGVGSDRVGQVPWTGNRVLSPVLPVCGTIDMCG